MTRLDRIVKGFNDYDKLVQELITWLDEAEGIVAECRVAKIRDEVSLLIGELKRCECRRKN